MDFTKKISIVGGDLRFVKLSQLLLNEGIDVYTYGLEKSEELKKTKEVIQCDTLDETIEKSSVIVGPIPFSNNNEDVNAPFSYEKIKNDEVYNRLKGKIFIAGKIPSENNTNGNKIIDILKREELTVLNSTSTAEGAIQIAMQETLTTLSECKILIMGFGRIGKILANKLKGIGADVYCEARKLVDFAWMEAYGYKMVKLEEIDREIHKFDIIINTIPYLVLDCERLKKIRQECIIIDLASAPGGVDKKEAEKMNIKVIHALGLPGKVAPLSSAKYIKETIKNIIMENKEGGL